VSENPFGFPSTVFLNLPKRPVVPLQRFLLTQIEVELLSPFPFFYRQFLILFYSSFILFLGVFFRDALRDPRIFSFPAGIPMRFLPLLFGPSQFTGTLFSFSGRLQHRPRLGPLVIRAPNRRFEQSPSPTHFFFLRLFVCRTNSLGFASILFLLFELAPSGIRTDPRQSSFS